MAPVKPGPWAEPVRLSQVSERPVHRRIAADQAARSDIARQLGLDRVDVLEAELTIARWLDGVEIRGRWNADIEQTCGVTLEPLPSGLEGDFKVRILPQGSPNAPEDPVEEVVVEPDAEDPPDILAGDMIDLGAYVVEHLALEIDPFPRKPGAVFVQPEGPEPPSPFEALRNFKTGPPRG
jgi:hypothetical protein